MEQNKSASPLTTNEEYADVRMEIVRLDERWATEGISEEERLCVRNEARELWGRIIEAKDYQAALAFYFRFDDWASVELTDSLSLYDVDDELKQALAALDLKDEERLAMAGGTLRSAFEQAFLAHRFKVAEIVIYRLTKEDDHHSRWALAATHDPLYRAWRRSRQRQAKTENAESQAASTQRTKIEAMQDRWSKQTIHEWFAFMDEGWTIAQTLRAEELKDRARVGNPYEQGEENWSEAEQQIRKMIGDSFFRLNHIVRGTHNVEDALEFYFRFVLPDPHLAAPYLDLKDEVRELPRARRAGHFRPGDLSLPLVHAVHGFHDKEEQVEQVGAAIRQEFSNAVLSGDMEYATAILTKIDDSNDPDWRLMASCDPAYRKWILFSGAIGPHLLRPGNEVFRAGSRGIPFYTDISRFLRPEKEDTQQQELFDAA